MSISLTHNRWSCNSWSGRFSHISGSYSVRNFFLRFGEGLSFHTLHFLIFRNAINDSAVGISCSNLKIFTSIPSDVCSIRWRNCWHVSGSCSWCLRNTFHIPLLHSGSFHSLFPSFRSFLISCPTLTWPYLLPSCTPRRATPAQRATPLLTAEYKIAPSKTWSNITMRSRMNGLMQDI
jgi:hypothetical protein